MKSLAKELPHPIQRYLLQLTELGNTDTTVLLERDIFIDYIIHYDFIYFIYISHKINMTSIPIVVKEVYYRCMAVRYHIASITAKPC